MNWQRNIPQIPKAIVKVIFKEIVEETLKEMSDIIFEWNVRDLPERISKGVVKGIYITNLYDKISACFKRSLKVFK